MCHTFFFYLGGERREIFFWVYHGGFFLGKAPGGAGVLGTPGGVFLRETGGAQGEKIYKGVGALYPGPQKVLGGTVGSFCPKGEVFVWGGTGGRGRKKVNRACWYFLFPDDGAGGHRAAAWKDDAERGFHPSIMDDARTPHDSWLGDEGQGWQVAMTTLTFERGAGEISGRERGAAYYEVLARVIGLEARPAHVHISNCRD